MLGLHVGHVHLPGYPEALYLGNIRHLETTVQLAHLVVIFHPDRYQTVLTYQGRFPGVNITLVLRQGFQFPALLSVDGFFAQERVRILVHVAAAHVVVGKVATHKVVLLGRRTADTARFLYGGQIEPFVIVLV